MNSFFQDFLEYDFLQNALLTLIFLCPLFGLISPLIHARKFAFMSSAVSHASLLGPSLTLLLFDFSNPYLIFISSVIITLLTILPLAHQSWANKNLPNDSLIGTYFSATMAIGVLISQIKPNFKGDLLSYLFGNLILINQTDLYITIFGSLLTMTFFISTFKKWILITYDPEGSFIIRLPVKKYHYIFFFFMTLIIITSIKLAGTILITSLLITPGLAGIIIEEKSNKGIKSLFTVSIIFSLVTSIGGLFFANAISASPGPTIALMQFLSLLLIKFYFYLT